MPEPLSTESANPLSEGLDLRSPREIFATIHGEDRRAVEAVGRAEDSILRAVERITGAFRAGGRLVYVGAGTSGRLGVLDASECAPTFSVDPGMVVGIIAGGEEALSRAIEGAEDSPEEGARAVEALSAGPRDVVCGIAASGRTPYVQGALAEAKRRGSATVLITCNREAAIPSDVRIILDVGPEVIAGSTRMKGGTATKLTLNILTTISMIRIGKVYDNLMVDVRPLSEKLRRRARGLVERLAGVGPDEAQSFLDRSGGRVKVAVVMARLGVEVEEATEILDRCDGFLRRAVAGGDR